jgi:diguanylate cyclase (GGDEF)-like protein
MVQGGLLHDSGITSERLMTASISVLHVGADAPQPSDTRFGRCVWRACSTLDRAQAALAESTPEALLITCEDEAQAQRLPYWAAWTQAVLATAVVVRTPNPSRALMLNLLQAGVQDVLPLALSDDESIGRSLCLAIERKRQEQELRRAWSIDLATGLPNRVQLMELLHQLCALRQREPAPMALLVIRVEGLASTEARLGVAAAQALRRKLAVRLRSGLRASDVVSALAPDAFAVVLTRLESPQDGDRVALKLAQMLREPFMVSAQTAVVTVSTGLAVYPDDGRQPDEMLKRALSAAVARRGLGRQGFADRTEQGAVPAANDD